MVNISQLRALEDTVIFNKAMEDSITPYFENKQIMGGSRAKISKGIKAEKKLWKIYRNSWKICRTIKP